MPAEQNLSELVRPLLAYGAQLTPEQREYLADTLGQNNTNTDLAKLPSFIDLQNAWEKTIPQTRILSLTEEYDNTVMWNAYSLEYSGVVMELECLDLYDSVLLLAEPVVYSNDPPSLGTLSYWIKMTTGQEPFDYDKLFKKLEITKATRWSYEKEWRVVSFDKKSSETYSDYRMQPRTFTKLFLGKDISSQDRQDLMALAHPFPHLEILEMVVDQNSQRLVFRKAQTT